MSTTPKHRRKARPDEMGMSITPTDLMSQAGCRCHLDGACPKHDSLGYTDEGRHARGRW